jgi:DNA polymerase-3 subunit delta
MYKNELDKHIQNNSCSNSIVLFGESSFLIDRYTELLSKKVNASILSFYFDEYNFSSAKAHLSQASLFGGDNILIVKSEKKVPKKDLDIFIDLCEKNQDNTFIYAYYGSDYKSYAKSFSKKSTMSVRFFNPDLGESINMVAQVARNKSVKIDEYSISHLLSLHNSDIALACNEIEKFKVFDTDITIKDIDRLVYGLANISIDDLIIKLFDKKDFKDDVKNILDHGEDEIRIITSITSYITQLYMFNIYIKVNGTPNALEILGYPAPRFVVDKKASMSLKFTPYTYYKLHELLLNSELKMKSSSVDKNAILLSTLIRVQQLL